MPLCARCYAKPSKSCWKRRRSGSSVVPHQGIGVMIWIGTSGWVYPHWVGRFYPPDLPVRDHLAYYAQHFPTVEINRSFYRLPTRDQFRSWAEQTAAHPGFLFAVKASRYITHLKNLRDGEEALDRLIDATAGLGERLGPCL